LAGNTGERNEQEQEEAPAKGRLSDGMMDLANLGGRNVWMDGWVDGLID
jgi:hypothetical protein